MGKISRSWCLTGSDAGLRKLRTMTVQWSFIFTYKNIACSLQCHYINEKKTHISIHWWKPMRRFHIPVRTTVPDFLVCSGTGWRLVGKDQRVFWMCFCSGRLCWWFPDSFLPALNETGFVFFGNATLFAARLCFFHSHIRYGITHSTLSAASLNHKTKFTWDFLKQERSYWMFREVIRFKDRRQLSGRTQRV